MRRHVAAGLAVGILAAGGISLLFGGGVVGWATCQVLGRYRDSVAVLAACVGLALPSRAVWPVAVAGLLVATVVLPVGVWLERRPPAPYDFVVVHEPADVRPDFVTAYQLAGAIAAAFDPRVGADRPARPTRAGSRSGRATWSGNSTTSRPAAPPSAALAANSAWSADPAPVSHRARRRGAA